MKPIYIVVNQNILNIIKESKRFMKNLGIAATHFNNMGYRSLYDKDKFLYYYINTYKRLIMAQGNIDMIKIYLDYCIENNVMMVYLNDNEYKHVIDINLLNEMGIDKYIDDVIKDLNEINVKNIKNINTGDNFKPDPEKIINNPGSVRYEDLVEYIKKYNSERYKI